LGETGERSLSVQKLKVTGPEVNTLVVGAGFNLSGDTRQWGVLTALKDGESYVRVQSFDGDFPARILDTVYHAKSRVLVADVLSGSEDAVKVTISEVITVEWPEAERYEGFTLTVHSRDQLRDIQWLVNPRELPFGMSVRGDLRPLQSADGVPRLRFPVGRVEFLTDGQSKPDTVEEARTKFQDAAKVDGCMLGFKRRYIQKLRSCPSVDKMRNLVRLARGDAKQGTTEQEKESVAKLLTDNEQPSLTLAEISILEGRKGPSQWLALEQPEKLQEEKRAARLRQLQIDREIYATEHKQHLQDTLARLQRLWCNTQGVLIREDTY
jgi:hypothetical protein